MRAFVTLSCVRYGYEENLYLIIQEMDGGKTIRFANTDMGKCWFRLFEMAYDKGIYMIDTSDDDDQSSTDRLIHNANPKFIGEGVYDLDTEEPIFLMWWTCFSFQGESTRLMSITEVLCKYPESELTDIFQKLSQVADIEVNGKMGLGSFEQLVIQHDNCLEVGYNSDFHLLQYEDDGRKDLNRN